MEANSRWRPMTRQLILRLAELVIESRFPEMRRESMQDFENPLDYSFKKNFSGKFGLNKDLENFPDFNKLENDNILDIIFHISPMNANVSPRGEVESGRESNLENWDEGKTIETWRISLEINENYVHDDEALINCYEKILKTVLAKSEDLPAFDFLNTMSDKLIDYQHIFNYRIKLDPCENEIESKILLTKEGVARVKSKTKSSEFKFDIGFGKIGFKVDYITIKSLAKINEYLVTNFSLDANEDENNPFNDTNVVAEYFSEHNESINSSRNSRQDRDVDETDDFVLITTSDNFGDASGLEKAIEFHSKLVLSPKFEEQKRFTFNTEHRMTMTKQPEKQEDYQFDTEALFRNKVNPSNKKFKITFDEDKNRSRCLSDTTACSRFKNILNQFKTAEVNANKPEVFEKKQFEYKNFISPTTMNNFVIDE
jgi:hypothetical protein